MVNEVVIASLYRGPSLVLLVIQTRKTLQIPIVLLSKRKVEGPMKLDTEILSLKWTENIKYQLIWYVFNCRIKKKYLTLRRKL